MASLPYPRCQILCVNSAGISFLPRISQIYTDTYGTLCSHGFHRIRRSGSYICAHLCHLWEALLCQKFLCVPCVLWEYLFSHGFHRFTQMLGCALFPRNSRNPQNLAAWVWQGCHTLLICEHPCHLWEALLCQKFPCVPCVPWENRVP